MDMPHALMFLMAALQLVAIGAIVMCAVYLGKIAGSLKSLERRQPPGDI